MRRASRAIGAAAAVVASLTLTTDAGAQTLRGVLSERDTYAPIELGEVTLVTTELDTLSQTLTDERGYFSFVVPGAGTYYLIASALGYRAVRSEEIEIGEGTVQIVELQMNARPVPLEGFLVEADLDEPEVPGLVGTGFYDRLAEGRGEFILPGQIAASTARYTQQLFWGMKTVRVHQLSHDSPGPWSDKLVLPNLTAPGYCDPSVYLDGVWVRDLNPGESIQDAVPRSELEAVEVYRWPFGVPARYKGAQACGVILFWTKAGRQ